MAQGGGGAPYTLAPHQQVRGGACCGNQENDCVQMAVQNGVAAVYAAAAEHVCLHGDRRRQKRLTHCSPRRGSHDP